MKIYRVRVIDDEGNGIIYETPAKSIEKAIEVRKQKIIDEEYKKIKTKINYKYTFIVIE